LSEPTKRTALEQVLDQIAADYTELSDVMGVSLWSREGSRTTEYLACLMTGEDQPVPGTTVWAAHTDLESLGQEMIRIYAAYKERGGI
jgi:hypothetical protein